jgi:hypothetical protein
LPAGKTVLLISLFFLQKYQSICDQASVEADLCTKDQLGSFLLAPNATDASKFQIISKAVNLRSPDAINYPVKKTGYYCVSTYAYSGQDYKAVVEFRNAYGELPAAQIPKLPFYGGLTIVYAVIGLYVPLYPALRPEPSRHLYVLSSDTRPSANKAQYLSRTTLLQF